MLAFARAGALSAGVKMSCSSRCRAGKAAAEAWVPSWTKMTDVCFHACSRGVREDSLYGE